MKEVLDFDDEKAVWHAFEKAIEHSPADTILSPVDVIDKLVAARLALRATCPCCGQRHGQALSETACKAVEAVVSGNATASEVIAVEALVACVRCSVSDGRSPLSLLLERASL